MSGRGVVIVTGGSRGIGRAILERFSKDGVICLNLSRGAAALPGVLDIAVDFADPAWEARLPARLLPLVKDQGPVCLVHNAAALHSDTALSLDAAAMRVALELNVVAPAALNRLLDPHLVSGSSILYIGSTLSEIGVPGKASYVTSKHALLGLMRATCQDLDGRSVHTAAVCPGFTDTEMLRESVGNSAAIIASIARRMTFGRLVEPKEIAEVVYFAAKNPVLNGAVLHANLGQKAS